MNDLTETYRESRGRDWAAFGNVSDPPPDYWNWWEEHSSGWKVPIQFLQPIGQEFRSVLDALNDLMQSLNAMEQVSTPPIEWIHITYIDVGFLRPTDVLWSQVESFYVNAAPRIRRVEPFSIRITGLSISEDGEIYLGVDDSGNYRSLRRQIRLGVPFIAQKANEDSAVISDEDMFIPRLPIGFTTGHANRQELLDNLSEYRDIDLGEFIPPNMKLARLPIQPHDHYSPIDVVAEIPLLGANHRKGYHN